MKQLTFVFEYSRQSEKFLERNPSITSRDKVEKSVIAAIKKLKKIDNNNTDVKPLKGRFKGLFRVRRGDIRIIFRFVGEIIVIVEVIDIGQRGGIYD